MHSLMSIVPCIQELQLTCLVFSGSWITWQMMIGGHSRSSSNVPTRWYDRYVQIYLYFYFTFIIYFSLSFSNSNFICNFKELLTTQITLIFCDYNICVTPKSSLSKSIPQWTLNDSCFGSLNRPLRSGTSLFLLMYPSNFTTGFSP